MVKLGYTAIADRAVLGAERLLNDTRVTELTEVERMTFRQIKYHLQALLSPLSLGLERYQERHPISSTQ